MSSMAEAIRRGARALARLCAVRCAGYEAATAAELAMIGRGWAL